ncbi:MAG: T9SS type A sorting domain-containing protein [Bacteroidetes bacterium]|nr:T9SS type A sorting domain-containing protein [Bacteroidota bacterium]
MQYPWGYPIPNANGGQTSLLSYGFDNAGAFIKFFGNNNNFTLNDMPFYTILGSGSNSGITYNSVYPFNINPSFRNGVSILNADFFQTVYNGNFGNNLNNAGYGTVLASVCNCLFKNYVAKNLGVQAIISAIQNSAYTFIANLQQALQNCLNNWACKSLNYIIIGLQSLIQYVLDTLQFAILQFTNILFDDLMINSTDEDLTNYSNLINMQYPGCSGVQLLHLGTDYIYPTYVRDILHSKNANPNIPTLTYSIPGIIGHALLQNQLLNVINDAPCSGSFNFFPIMANTDWQASNRCDLTTNNFRACPDEMGDFQGTDYMLLHNLYYLREGYNIGLQDYSYRTITTSMPIGNNFTTSNPRTFGAYEYIYGKNAVNSTSKASYRAGKEVALLDDGTNKFSAILGCEFHAYISPFNGVCDNTADMFKTANQNNTNEMFDEVVNQVSKPEKNNYVGDLQKKSISFPDTLQIKQAVQNQLDSIVKRYLSSSEVVIQSSTFEIYPNPSNSDVYLNYTNKIDDVKNSKIEICNSLGQVIFSTSIKAENQMQKIDISEFTKGVYFINLITNNKIVCVKKLTKI